MQHHHSQIDPIYKKGQGDAAVLLIHGFTGTPDIMRPLANHLHKQGFTVQVPLLAGHGTTKENLAKTNWKDWYKSTTDAFNKLREDYNFIFVAGLSLGGLLALKLAEDFPNNVQGLSCMATPIHFKTWVHMAMPMVKYSPLKMLYQYQPKHGLDVKDPEAKTKYWTIDAMPISCVDSIMDLQAKVRSGLESVTCPTLLMHSRYDSTAPYNSMSYIARHISSEITEAITLENSFHLVTVDYEKKKVCEKTNEFFKRCLA